MVLRDDSEKRLLDAMAMEKEYRKLQTAGTEAKEAFGYHDKLKQFGFADTIEYERAKAEYYFSNVKYEIKQVSNDKEVAAYTYAIENRIPTIIFSIPTIDTVHIGTSSEYNKAYCDANNVSVIKQDRNGGAVVGTKNDLIIIYYNPFSAMTTEIFKEKIIDMVKLWHKEVIVDHNDILISGYKVAGFGFDRKVGSVGLIMSFSINKTLIENVCTKVTTKQPRGIGEFVNVSRDDAIREIGSWLH